MTGDRDAKAYLFASVRNTVLSDAKVRQRNVALDPDLAWFAPPNRDFAGEAKLRRALSGLPSKLQRAILNPKRVLEEKQDFIRQLQQVRLLFQ